MRYSKLNYAEVEDRENASSGLKNERRIDGEHYMASKEDCDRFAAEMAQRFEDFIKWAADHWPNKDFPLLPSDFSESRKEIQQILGNKLNESREMTVGPRADDGTVQYVNMNPAPWP